MSTYIKLRKAHIPKTTQLGGVFFVRGELI